MNSIRLTVWLSILVLATAAFSLPAAEAGPRVQTRNVRITERGFEPDTLVVRRGIRVRITFLRTTDNTCAKEVVFPDFGVKRDLPLNQAVVITLAPNKKGEFRFTCGMNMMNGKLIVQ